jgi:putative phosphoribosylformylglycinamidine synthase
MRTPQLADNLRRAVLQAAIEGKLNDRTNENARDLLAAIQTEKAAQQKTGSLKKTKPLAAISEEEIPFEIPENWVWVRLGELLFQLTDGSHSTPKYTNQGVPFLSVKNISSGKISFEDTKFISKEEHLELTKRCKPEKGDILLSKVGTTGIPVLVKDDIEFSIFVSIALLKFSSHFICPQFLIYFIQSPLVQEQAKQNTRGVGNKNWVLAAIANTTIPLPPLTEQQQIVAKLNRLLTEIDELKTQEQALLATQNAFPKKLRAALLQAAVQGELNERTSENARDLLAAIQAEKAALQKAGKLKKDKPLAAISEEEIPFAIPENWMWVRLGEIVNINSGVTFKKEEQLKIEKGNIRVLRGGNIKNNSIHFLSDDIYLSPNNVKDDLLLNKNDILTPAVTSIENVGKFGIVREHVINTTYGGFVFRIRLNNSCHNFVNAEYLFAILQSPFVVNQMKERTRKSGQAFYNLGKESFKTVLFPLPPLTEQQQIVTKLDALLAEIDTLENAT